MLHDALSAFLHIWSARYSGEEGETTTRHAYDLTQLLVRFFNVASDSLSHAPQRIVGFVRVQVINAKDVHPVLRFAFNRFSE